MERHKCKLCFKCFSNGRALGGHMRSHMMNLPLPDRKQLRQDEEEDDHHHHPSTQLSEDTESASSSSSSSEEEAEAEGDHDHEKGTLYYGLRENPKKSVRLVDHEFAFAVDAASVVLPDRESETESSKNPTRRRSKRPRKLLDRHQYYIQHQHQHQHQHQQQPQEEQGQEQENNNSNIKKLKYSNKTAESWIEPEPVSSISDTTTEENVAFCLMMLSRDKWKRKEKQNHHQEEERHDQEEEEEEEEADKSIEETDESEDLKSCKTKTRGKYRCDTCSKVFKSYQALGGHRASHKKLKPCTPIQETGLETRDKNYNNNNNNAFTSSSVAVKKLHECPYCYRVFSSGQALGGHKRSHGLTSVPTTTPARSSTAATAKVEDNLHLIDLNLPAPIDEDDLSQVELSAVSDAEFVNHIKR